MRRIITALVSKLMEYSDPESEKLKRFNKVARNLFSESESIEFYCGQGMNIFDSELASAIIKTPVQLRQQQLYRTELDGDSEQASLIESAHKKLSR